MTHDSSDTGTIVHLPECVELNAFDSQYGYTTSCKCERLRVYAAKVRLEDDDYAHVAAQAEAEGRRRGWNEALDAAREAVARTCGHTKHQDGRSCAHDDALAAIDALRGSGNPGSPTPAEKGEQA